MNCVLITIHLMLGLDGHKELGIVPPAPAPVPAPFYPHIVGATLRWLMRPAMAETVQSWGFSSMQRGTDIQSGIPHVPVPLAPFNLVWPILTAFSGSKSHFGVATVLVEKKPVAVAVTVAAVGHAVAVAVATVGAAPEPGLARVVAARQVHPGTVAGIGVAPAVVVVVVGVAAVVVVGIGAQFHDHRQGRHGQADADAHPVAAPRGCDHAGTQQQCGQGCGKQ